MERARGRGVRAPARQRRRQARLVGERVGRAASLLSEHQHCPSCGRRASTGTRRGSWRACVRVETPRNLASQCLRAEHAAFTLLSAALSVDGWRSLAAPVPRAAVGTGWSRSPASTQPLRTPQDTRKARQPTTMPPRRPAAPTLVPPRSSTATATQTLSPPSPRVTPSPSGSGCPRGSRGSRGRRRPEGPAALEVDPPAAPRACHASSRPLLGLFSSRTRLSSQSTDDEKRAGVSGTYVIGSTTHPYG